jgi:hypothetical protein
MSNDANKGYKFDIQNGVIRAVYEIENGRMKWESIDQGESWTVDGTQVVKTEYDDGRLENTRYVDADGDGIYSKVNTTYAAGSSDDVPGASSDNSGNPSSYSANLSGREKYSFELNNGTVVAAFELEHGVKQRKSLDYNERYTLEGGDVLKVETKYNGEEITRYSDVDGDGLFAKVSEQWVGNAANTAVAPVIRESLHYEGNERDEHIGLTADGASFGGGGSDQFVFRQLGHVKVDDFHHAEGDKLVFDTGLGLTSLAQLLGFVSAIRDNGQETVVEFGDSVSLTLVGVNAASLTVSDFQILS